MLARASDMEFGSHISSPNHKLPGFDKTGTVAAYRNLTERNRLKTSEALAESIREMEHAECKFLSDLQLEETGQLMVYEYESLLLPRRQAHLAAIFQFLLRSSSAAVPASMAARALNISSMSEDDTGAQLEGVTLHPPTCSSRVTDWPKLRTLLHGTYTQAACDRLEEAFAVSNAASN